MQVCIYVGPTEALVSIEDGLKVVWTANKDKHFIAQPEAKGTGIVLVQQRVQECERFIVAPAHQRERITDEGQGDRSR